MKKLLLTPLLLASAMASAQVVLTANVPQYNFQVLAGSERQISVHMTGGATNKINWSVAATTGGASATLDRTTNAPGTTGVTIGPTPGACSIAGPVGSYVVSSTATVTVQAQSVDDPTKTAHFLFNVCANTTKVQTLPAYQQAYSGQAKSVQSYVVGNTDESGKWSIISQPAGASGTLADANKRDTLFTGTVSGRYTLQYTSAADPSKSGTAIVYVSPNPMPYTSTKNLTQPTECYADPQLTGKDYEVGPGQAYATISSIPTNNWTPGSIMRIHNADQTGANPTTYHEGTRIMAGGTASQPVIMCGVADAAGNLPVIDGQNSKSAPWNTPSTQAGGIIDIWGQGQYQKQYATGGAGPDYVIISGLATQHAGLAYNYVPADGSAPLAQWSIDAACIGVRSGQHLLIEGNDMNQCSNGLFIANNSAGGYGYSSVTEFIYIRGNRMRNSGFATYFKAHDAYVQNFWGVVEGNRFESTALNSHGDGLKWRGTEGIFRYNFFDNIFGGDQLINEESATDAMPYITFETMLGAPGDASCGNPYCQYEAGYSADILTAYQEALEKDTAYGNIFVGRGLQESTIQYGDSGGGGTYQWTNQTEMSDHLGTMRFYNNTVDQPEFSVFQNAGIAGVSDTEQEFYKPREIIANNIMYKSTQSPASEFAFGQSAAFIATFQTNLMNAGTVDMTAPINGLPYTQINSFFGWMNYTDAEQFPLALPVDGHIFGLSSANFLMTTCQPYNPVTFAPVPGCGAIGAGSPLTEPFMALLPVRSQYSVEQAAVIPRTNPLTLGAVDTGSQPTLASIVFTPDTAAQLSSYRGLGYGVYPVVLDCTYSDGLHTACGPSATLSYSDGTKSFQTIGGNKVVAQNAGATSGVMTATIGNIKGTTPYANNAPGTVGGLAVSPYYTNVNVRSKVNITATASYADSTSGDVTSTATWTSNNSSVATVAGGVVTGVGMGTAIITVSLQSQFQIVTVNVNAAATTVNSIAVTTLSPSIVAGATTNLTAIATSSDGSTADISTSSLTSWTTSNAAVATVANGVVTGVGSGSAVITAGLSGVSGASTVKVTGSSVSVSSIAVTPGSAAIASGQTAKLTATATNSDGTMSDITSTPTTSWTTSNPAVATVTGGLVTSVGSGTAVVTASYGPLTGTATIKVASTSPTVSSITITPKTSSAVVGAPIQLTATAKYSDNTTGDVSNSVTWTSSNTTVATISGKTIVPVAVGSVNITASMTGIKSSIAVLSIKATHQSGTLGGNAVVVGNVH